jgi:hypothetical protein
MLKKINKISESLVVEGWEENKDTFLSKIKKFDPLTERDNGDQIFYSKAGMNYAVWDKRHNLGLILVESKIKEHLNIDFKSLFDNKISRIKESEEDDAELGKYLDSLTDEIKKATERINQRIDSIKQKNQKGTVSKDDNLIKTNLMILQKINDVKQAYDEYKENIDDKYGDISESSNGGFEVHYSDGIRRMKSFKNINTAIDFAKNLIKNNDMLQHVDIFKADSGFHSTADDKYLIAWYGDGSYWDNRSKKEPKLLSKKIQIEESQDISESLKQSDLKSLSTNDLISILKRSADDIKTLIKTIEKRKDITDKQNRTWWSIVDDLSDNITKD